MRTTVELWAVVVVPAFIAVIAVVGLVRRGTPGVSSARNRTIGGLVLAAAVAPATVTGGAIVFAVFVVGNFLLGRAEFVPFSWFSMFSVLPEKQTVIFLQTTDGVRVSAAGACGVQAHELPKLFHQARRSAGRDHPDWPAQKLDEVGAYFVGLALLRSHRRLAMPALPDDLQIMVAELTSTADGPVAEERRVLALAEVAP